MFSKIIETEFYRNGTQTLFLCLTLSMIYLLLYVVNIKRSKDGGDKQKLQVRMNYVAIILFVFFAAKIWVQGFTHIFYGLSLVSAGLVVTNKESIMNLVGWCIISWRGLFIEGDYIEVGESKGYVYELGVLYFKILESSAYLSNHASGRIIKVPNGMVINSAIKSYTPKKHFIEKNIELLVSSSIDVSQLKQNIQSMLNADFQKRYNQAMLEAKKILKKEGKLISGYLFHAPFVSVHFLNDKVDVLKLSVTFVCLANEADSIVEYYKELIMGQVGLIPSDVADGQTSNTLSSLA